MATQTTETGGAQQEPRADVDETDGSSVIGTVSVSERVRRLYDTVLYTQSAVCGERALLVTRYFKKRSTRKKPVVLQKGEALAYILRNKKVRIYPDELLVGCFSSHRVGGSLFPELHGLIMFEDLFTFRSREVNPLSLSFKERRQLLTKVLPFWLTRFLALRIRPFREALRIVREQLTPTFYLINELGGISHIVPDYKGLVSLGTQGFRQKVAEQRENVSKGSTESAFLLSIEAVCDGLDGFADGYRREALRLAGKERNEKRKTELEQIAETCAQVPRKPARTFREALQSLFFAQIALNLESLDNAVSPGRLDQVLWPYYQRDIQAKELDRQTAFELLGCFAVKMSEIIPAFSRRITRFHGGLFNGQAVVVGGTDEEGRDATNELSYLFLELMEHLRTRQPNFQARLHKGSPQKYRARIAKALAAGSVSPALYNDHQIVPLLKNRGVSEKHARDYAPVGCVEPASAGRSFFSTDAALFNLPLCLELALNKGRRFSDNRRLGGAIENAETCRSIDALFELFKRQVAYGTKGLLRDIRLVEDANARVHPTPLTSMLLKGCISSRRDASSGGTLYNGSGLQGVGVVEVGDSLAAIETVVFRQKKASMSEVIQACRRGFEGYEVLRARLRTAPKFGNDDPFADQYTARVMELFTSCIRGEVNTRGGRYVSGFYSVTSHEAFGKIVGALPSGRYPGQPFSSGISPSSGCERAGPTAALMSAAHLPLDLAHNGVNQNIEITPWTVKGEKGRRALQGLIDGAFAAGCMQMQVNVIDPKILLEARDNPGRYPNLLVRVSGYAAYFDDLSPAMKQEVIDRTHFDLGS